MALVVYTDTFERYDLWTPVDEVGTFDYRDGVVPKWNLVGDWQLAGDLDAVRPPADATYSAYLKPTSTPDATIYTEGGRGGDPADPPVNPPPVMGELQGVVARWVDDEHWLALIVVGDQAELQQCDGGAPTTLFASPSADPITQMRLEVAGAVARCMVYREGTLSPNYLATDELVDIPDGPLGHQHGLISYGTTHNIALVQVTVDEIEPPAPRRKAHPVSLRLDSTTRYIDAVLRDDPLAFWPLDEGTDEHGVNLPLESLTGGISIIQSAVADITNRGGTVAANTSVVAVASGTLSTERIGTYGADDDFTIEAWIRRTESDSSGEESLTTIRLTGYTFQPPATWLPTLGWDLKFLFDESTFRYFGSPGDPISTGPVLDIGELTYIVVTHVSGQGTRIYRDGAQVDVLVPDDTGTQYPRDPSPGVDLAIYGGLQPGFLALYQSALTPAQIDRHYRAATGPTLRASHARAHALPLSEPQTPTLGATHRSGHIGGVYTAAPHNPTLVAFHTQRHAVGFDDLAHRPDLNTLRSWLHQPTIDYTHGPGLLPVDPNNLAPVGQGRYPIGGTPTGGPPPTDELVLLTEDGEQLVTEDGEPIIAE